MKTGGRTACAGPVYHFDDYPDSPNKLPRYYDNCLFIYEWSRHWIMVVHLDENSNRVKIEPFLEGHSLKRPVDLKFGPEGELYVLEYGDTWGVNDDSRLLRVDYNRGNRAPFAQISATGHIGRAPLKVAFSSAGTADADAGDKLRYEWRTESGGEVVSTEPHPTITFDEDGVYNVELTVLDPHGATSVVRTPTLVGNSLPELKFEYPRPGGFFHWDRDLRFKVAGYDYEDDESMGKIVVRGGESAEEGPSDRDPIGLKLMRGSDCFNCHAFGHKIVGPSILEIAKRYEGDAEALDRAAQRVIDGSATVWSEVPMLPHPQHTLAETRQMVAWILGQKDGGSAPVMVDAFVESALRMGSKPEGGASDTYVLTASYTDLGSDPVGPLTITTSVLLRDSRIEGEAVSEREGVRISQERSGRKRKYVVVDGEVAWAQYFEIDLGGIGQVMCRASSDGGGGMIEFRKGARDGEVLGSVEIGGTGGKESYRDFVGEIRDPGGAFELFVVFRADQGTLNLDWFEFQPGN